MKGARQWLDSSWGRSREDSPSGTGEIRFVYTPTGRREEFGKEPPTRSTWSKKARKTCWIGRRSNSARRCSGGRTPTPLAPHDPTPTGLATGGDSAREYPPGRSLG